MFYHKKGVHFGLKSQCKKGSFELKCQRFATKKWVIFKLENKDGYNFFPVNEGAWGGASITVVMFLPGARIIQYSEYLWVCLIL